MNTNQSKRPSDAVIEAARDLAKRLPSGQAEPVYHACIELRRLRKALAELDRQRAETCTARDDTPSKSRTKRIAIQRSEEGGGELDAAKPAVTLGGNVPPVGASIRCTRCGEQTEVAFNYGTSVPGCCNQSPCAHPGVGPCLRPAKHAPTDSSVALAIDWARANAGEHADTIIEALAAYDPECGGRTAQRGGWASEAADAQLADTQRAIIEAAETRGYERAKAESEADARDAYIEDDRFAMMMFWCALNDANEACRSAFQVVERCANGDVNANWTALRDRLSQSLKRQHDAMYVNGKLALPLLEESDRELTEHDHARIEEALGKFRAAALAAK